MKDVLTFCKMFSFPLRNDQIKKGGAVLFKTRIKKGVTTLKVPESAQDKHWIATLNGKMLGK